MFLELNARCVGFSREEDVLALEGNGKSEE